MVTASPGLSAFEPRPLPEAQVTEHLARVGLGKQKWPEELRVVDDFPRTASGKVRKHVLRDLARRSPA